MGKTDTQSGQRLSLKCSECKRTLRIYYRQKNILSSKKLTVLNGSVHKTKDGNLRIHAQCKCGVKTVFEKKSTSVTKQGWRRIS